MSTDLEERVEKLEQWMQHLPGIIKIGFDEAAAQRELIKARIARLHADVADTRSEVAQLSAKVYGLETKIDALPRVIAEMLAARE